MAALSNCASRALSGLPRDCSTSQGGISEVYLAAFDDVQTPVAAEPSGKIETITMNETAKFKRYHFRKNTGSMSSALTVDPANGVNFVQTTLNLSFLRMETQKRIEMAAMSVNEMAAIVRDSNGTYWYLGLNEPLAATAGTGETGQQKTDGNRYTLTLVDEQNSWPLEVDPKALASIIAE